MRRAAGALVLTLVAWSSAPSVADHRVSFTSAGSCEPEIGFYVPIDAGRARAAIDDERFTVVEHGGIARLGLFVELCSTSIDGGPPSGSIIGGVFVETDTATSVAGCGSYDFAWTGSTGDDWLEAMRDLGWDAPLVPGSTLTAETIGGALASVEGAVPLARGPWSMRLDAPLPTHPAVPFVSVHCTVGARGVVRGTFDHRFTSFGVGLGEVRFGDGPLWEALGIAGSKHVLPGLIFNFTWEGVTELVEAS